jgi:hypothetical protein
MITNRPLEAADLDMLYRALGQDEYGHAAVANYTQDGAYSEVYEDEKGPIAVLRYTKTLRLVGVWCDNKDFRRNALATMKALEDATNKAKASGFTDIIFTTESPTLARFCKRLGFQESGEQYVKYV